MQIRRKLVQAMVDQDLELLDAVLLDVVLLDVVSGPLAESCHRPIKGGAA